jgi:hypothetical protein
MSKTFPQTTVAKSDDPRNARLRFRWRTSDEYREKKRRANDLWASRNPKRYAEVENNRRALRYSTFMEIMGSNASCWSMSHDGIVLMLRDLKGEM